MSGRRVADANASVDEASCLPQQLRHAEPSQPKTSLRNNMENDFHFKVKCHSNEERNPANEDELHTGS